MDHLAVASERAWDNMIRYCYHLGGEWLGGPTNDPDSEAGEHFYFAQVAFANGTKIELLEPLPGNPGSDFIRRYLWRNGPGPHHYTFKVPDLDEAMAAVSGAGYELVGVNRENPNWQEAFLHPKQSHGIVIQLACQGGEGGGWIDATALPPAGRAVASLDRCVHLVADLSAATKLFGGVLNLTEMNRGTDRAGEFVELANGPWVLRLVQPEHAAWRHWLGDRAGRLHHVAVSLDDPASVPGAMWRPAAVDAAGDGSDEAASDAAYPERYEIPPEYNLGLRLRLNARR